MTLRAPTRWTFTRQANWSLSLVFTDADGAAVDLTGFGGDFRIEPVDRATSLPLADTLDTADTTLTISGAGLNILSGTFNLATTSILGEPVSYAADLVWYDGVTAKRLWPMIIDQVAPGSVACATAPDAIALTIDAALFTVAPEVAISFSGPPGLRGPGWIGVTAPPGGGDGNDGDFAWDYTNRVFYGPKAAGIWPSGIQINHLVSGAGAPAGGTGENGDLYFDTTARAFYGPKAAGVWGSATILNTILNGSGAPGGGTGVNGDIYIDPAAKMIYGPKAAGVWPAGIAMGGLVLKRVDVFTASGTFTKQAGDVLLDIHVVGGGGGGGSGRRSAPGVQAGGGAGGNGGARVEARAEAAGVTATVSVTVGAGGTGAGAAADSTNGTAGTDGGISQFGAYLLAQGGKGGGGGTSAAGGAQGTAQVNGFDVSLDSFPAATSRGGAGAASGAGVNFHFSSSGAGGGGGGGGITTGNVASAGALASIGAYHLGSNGRTAAGGGGAVGTAGGNGATPSVDRGYGSGGGGGGAQTGAASGNGGTGGNGGGGGGGGGGGRDTFGGGAGGNGGNGRVVVLVYG